VSLFLDRSRRSGHMLEWKVRIFAVAAVLGLAGIYFVERWMTVSAIALLMSGMLLRFTPAFRRSEDDDEDEDDGAPSDEGERAETV